MYSFRDFGPPDFASALIASGTSDSRISCPHVLLQRLRVPGLRVRMYSFRDPPHVLLQGLRVPGLRVRINCFRDFGFPDFVSAYIALGTSGPSACTPSGNSGPRTSRPH
ncbi:hypothetical protein CRG98_043953 [Punica granatum]|uniref:Uncharacterized protein n=1 Tax=Punica granatum TaxID=22663 RepID=A0A2I0HVB9_PUNGR|nr:hypothetical protein CRG98_043953 [Punica granatum]